MSVIETQLCLGIIRALEETVRMDKAGELSLPVLYAIADSIIKAVRDTQ